MSDVYYVGHITTTHKLMGAVKISTSFQILEDIVGKRVIASKNDNIKILFVKKVEGFNGKRAIISFDEINGIDDAKEIIDADISIRKDLVPEYEEEKSIIGYKVLNFNESIGQVVDVMENKAQDILVVKGEKEILIPFIDVFVKEIDDEREEIQVELIEGML
ncbi:ribosome maturation factor RimM [uncultured Sneathia sp.]|uniref:ribosome maturation factor RimM n=1 Tax=uncultured Sneathia sp. TaxID=278067 RepID=UPI002593C38A|nr:ribosome maturation factor RimM [uncultured Sneathia sp.]